MASYYIDPKTEKKAQGMGPPAPTSTQGAPNTPNSLNASAAQPADGVAVRNAMTNAGLDNSKIGWNQNTGMVTYNGADLMKPNAVTDGVSYANQTDVNQAIVKAYADSGNPLATATDYFTNAGVDNAVQYRGDGLISIGSQTIKPAMITSTGKALVPTDQLEQALQNYRQQTGIKSNQDVYKAYEDKYGGKIEGALDSILNREAWSYDPDKDAAYQAYKEMYAREGNRALQDAVGGMSSMTGGYTSSAAATAGLQAQNYYMQQMNDRIPELMANDYTRYMGEQQLRQQALNSLLNVSNDEYNKQYQANRDTIADVNAANNANWQRDMYERQYADSHTAAEDAHKLAAEELIAAQAQNKYLPQQLANAQYRDDILTQYYKDNQIADLDAKRLSNNGMEQANKDAVWEAALRAGQLRDYFTDEEARLLGLPMNEDGSYVSPWNTEIGYWNAVGKPQYDYQTDKELANQKDLISYQAATNAKYAKSRSSGGSRSSRTSASKAKAAAKTGADDAISKWLYTTKDFDGVSNYGSYTGNENPQYAAADKLSNPETLDVIKSDLMSAGYTESQANSKIKEYRTNVAKQVAQIEGQNHWDDDVIKSIKERYGW